jgi:hypothetical protein
MASIAASVTQRRRFGLTQSEQHLGAAGGETAPLWASLLPAGDSAIIIDMRRPHAAMRSFAQTILAPMRRG